MPRSARLARRSGPPSPVPSLWMQARHSNYVTVALFAGNPILLINCVPSTMLQSVMAPVVLLIRCRLLSLQLLTSWQTKSQGRRQHEGAGYMFHKSRLLAAA